jgi:hypothetical protein
VEEGGREREREERRGEERENNYEKCVSAFPLFWLPRRQVRCDPSVGSRSTWKHSE